MGLPKGWALSRSWHGATTACPAPQATYWPQQDPLSVPHCHPHQSGCPFEGALSFLSHRFEESDALLLPLQGLQAQAVTAEAATRWSQVTGARRGNDLQRSPEKAALGLEDEPGGRTGDRAMLRVVGGQMVTCSPGAHAKLSRMLLTLSSGDQGGEATQPSTASFSVC